MATVNKDFKIKSGLIVEGTTATVNGYDILTKKPADDQYIIDLIGGETLVKSVSSELSVDGSGQLSIDRNVTDDWYDASGEAAAAELNAKNYADGLASNYDPAGSAFDAQQNAEGYTDAQLTNYTTTANLDTAIDGYGYLKSADLTGYATESYVDQAETDANAYADSLINDASNLSTEVWSAYKTNTEIGLAQSAAESYADTAIANLVDSAPATLDTLNELAAALQDNPDIITDLQDIAAGKQDTLTAGSNIDITGATISVTGLDSADISDFNTAALSATASAYDVAGAAATAQSNAEDYADGLAVNYDAAGAAATAEQNAKDYADALDTDDVAEGSINEYFTDSRAKASAADLLTGATLTNITITGSGAGLTITAENGVADSNTDNLAEGSNNLYFTDSRVLDAISTQNIQPGSIDITWVRREEATWTNVATASKATCHSASTSEGSMKYLVRVTASVGGTRHSHVTEVLATVDGSNGVAVVEYGTIYTSAEPLATVTVEWNASTSEYDLNVTTANNNSEVMVAATLMAVLD